MLKRKSLNIVIKPQAAYAAEQSDPSSEKFVWSYKVEIHNNSRQTIQLLARRWFITDMAGKIEDIQGTGVVGLQPLIKPGYWFSYTSCCQLLTPLGTMEGYYEVQNLKQELFVVDIPKFVLSAPPAITRVYKSILH